MDNIELVRVFHVIDGDTVILSDGRHVRYLGIDAPEFGEYYAYEATAVNKALVEGQVVKLESGNHDTDCYGRFLRYVYAGGIFVNAELIAQGYATACIFDDTEKYSRMFINLEQKARLYHRGIWAP